MRMCFFTTFDYLHNQQAPKYYRGLPIPLCLWTGFIDKKSKKKNFTLLNLKSCRQQHNKFSNMSVVVLGEPKLHYSNTAVNGNCQAWYGEQNINFAFHLILVTNWNYMYNSEIKQVISTSWGRLSVRVLYDRFGPTWDRPKALCTKTLVNATSCS